MDMFTITIITFAILITGVVFKFIMDIACVPPSKEREKPKPIAPSFIEMEHIDWGQSGKPVIINNGKVNNHVFLHSSMSHEDLVSTATKRN